MKTNSCFVSQSTLLNIAQWSFVILGVIWLIFAEVSVSSALSTENQLSSFTWLSAVLMFANSLVLIFLGWRWGEGKRWLYYFGLLVLFANIILTFTDEFGLFDLLYLILAGALFVYLLVTRKLYV